MTKETYQQFLLTYLHKPYIWGGDDPIKGLDCSGFAQEALSPLGFDPDGDQTAQGLFLALNKVPGAICRINKGINEYFVDIGYVVFYGSSLTSITHVALGFDKNIIIEAGGGGSKTITQQDAINQNAFIRLRSFGKRKDVVSVITLPIIFT